MKKKSVFKTYMSHEVKCTEHILENLNAECALLDIVSINLFDYFTGDPLNSIASITTLPTNGNATISGGILTYENTSGSSGSQDYIGISIKEGECTYGDTVVIFLKSEVLPVYISHEATKQITEINSCAISGASNVTIYTDGATLAGSSLIYTDAGGINRAPVGYYRVGSISRYWSGTMFGDTYNC